MTKDQGAETSHLSPPAARSSNHGPWSLVLGHWAFLAIAAAIAFLRRPDQFTNPQLWAEDGIFFFQARTQGLHAFLLELAGYFHLAPRTVAALANLVDPAFVPHVFVGATLALTLYVMSRVLSPRCPLPFRPACALALVLVPDASEVLLNTNNLQWVFIPGFVALLLSAEPTRRSQRLHDSAAALFFGFTSPFSVIMTPFFAWRAYTRRTRTSLALAVIVTVCALLQIVSIFRHPLPPPSNPTFDPHAAFAFGGLRVLGGLFAPFLPPTIPTFIAPVFTLTLLGALTFLALRPSTPKLNSGSPIPAPCSSVTGPWSFVISPSSLIALVFFASLASTIVRCWHSMPVLCAPDAATRYVYPLQVLFVWLLVARLRDSSRAIRLTCAALLVLSLSVNARRLRIAPIPDKQWSLYAPKLRAGEEVTVPINPDGWNFPFPAR